MAPIRSKLPQAGTSIFAVMTALAQEHGAINLAQGFPNFNPPDRLMELIAQAMQEGYNQYAPMPGWLPLREAIAEKVRLSYGYRPDPGSEITVTAGATQAIFNLVQALIHPGDEVVILEPAYDSYLPSITLAGGRAVPVPLSPPHYRTDWDRVRAAIGPRTRMLMVNNPHNPSGTILGEEDLAALKAIVLEHDLILLSDEVYEHLVFDGHRHLSVLRDPELYARSVVTFSFGKTFHSTGWKTGYVVAPEAFTAEYRKVHQFAQFSVHTPSQVGLARFMEDPAAWSGLDAFYQHKRDLFLGALEGSALRPLPCEGTYFGLLDYSALSDEDDLTFSRNFTAQAGVALIPLSPFYSEPPRDSRVVRACFAKTDELLRQAAEKLRSV